MKQVKAEKAPEEVQKKADEEVQKMRDMMKAKAEEFASLPLEERIGLMHSYVLRNHKDMVEIMKVNGLLLIELKKLIDER